MKAKFNDLLERISNKGTIVAIASAVIIILNNLGVFVDSEKVMAIIDASCTIGILLGVLNDTKSAGMYIPMVTKPKIEEPTEKVEEKENNK